MTIATTWTAEAPRASAACRAPIDGLAAALTVLLNLSGRGARAAGVRTVRIPTADGRTLPVHVQGTGPAVVLVHGLGGSHRDWDRLAAELAGRHTVIRYDALGHGARVGEAGPDVDLARLAGELAAVVASVRPLRPLLVGHSMGALTVLQYLRDHGDAAVSGVCVLDQSPRIVTDAAWRCGLFGEHSAARHDALIDRMRTDFAATVLHEAAPALPRFVREAIGRDGWVRRAACRALGAMRTAPLLSLLASLGRADFRDLVPGLSVPVMVVLGGRSRHYGGVPLADWYRGAIARGRVVRYDASAHSPHRREAARLARDLVAFVATYRVLA